MLKFNNEFTIKNLGEEVLFKGWVDRIRNLGGIIFIDLRDRSGIIQVTIKPNNYFYALAMTLKSEDVIEVVGRIVKREKPNTKIKNGDIEVELDSLKLLAKAKELPFSLHNTTATEENRLRYRYLDIRRSEILNNLILRNEIIKEIRDFLGQWQFIEIETPLLTKSTPEGARDYLVASRVHPGSFYALPQSPQMFKQLLMVGGVERYFQIARCFRDEDLRADRQPEFTQLDLEMSFVDQTDVIELSEQLFKNLFNKILNINITEAFDKIDYCDAIENYGTDKPDMRFDLTIKDITPAFEKTAFQALKPKKAEVVNCLILEKNLTRKQQAELIAFTKDYGLDNLYFLSLEKNEWQGSLAKKLTDEKKWLAKNYSFYDKATFIIAKGKKAVVKKALGALRLKLGDEFQLISEGLKPLWVVNFPLFEYDEKNKKYNALHHPFTAPLEETEEYLEKPDECLAKAFDLVINGNEIGGGSIRINDPYLQAAMFKTLGLKEKEIQEKFGFLLEAFNYGTPPHGGIAFGVERIIMLFSDTNNIKDVIAFPKTAHANCLMTNAPSSIDKKQLEELKLKKVIK